MIEPTRDRTQFSSERQPSSSKEAWDIIHATPITEQDNLLRETQIELHQTKLQLRKVELELSETKLHRSELRLKLSEQELVLRQKETEIQQKNSELASVQAELDLANRVSMFHYLITFISASLFGFGINLVIYHAIPIGWVMIVIAVIIQALSLYRNYGQKKK